MESRPGLGTLRPPLEVFPDDAHVPGGLGAVGDSGAPRRGGRPGRAEPSGGVQARGDLARRPAPRVGGGGTDSGRTLGAAEDHPARGPGWGSAGARHRRPRRAGPRGGPAGLLPRREAAGVPLRCGAGRAAAALPGGRGERGGSPAHPGQWTARAAAVVAGRQATVGALPGGRGGRARSARSGGPGDRGHRLRGPRAAHRARPGGGRHALAGVAGGPVRLRVRLEPGRHHVRRHRRARLGGRQLVVRRAVPHPRVGRGGAGAPSPGAADLRAHLEPGRDARRLHRGADERLRGERRRRAGGAGRRWEGAQPDARDARVRDAAVLDARGRAGHRGHRRWGQRLPPRRPRPAGRAGNAVARTRTGARAVAHLGGLRGRWSDRGARPGDRRPASRGVGGPDRPLDAEVAGQCRDEEPRRPGGEPQLEERPVGGPGLALPAARGRLAGEATPGGECARRPGGGGEQHVRRQAAGPGQPGLRRAGAEPRGSFGQGRPSPAPT